LDQRCSEVVLFFHREKVDNIDLKCARRQVD
jgi:hypothetical protein